MSAKMCQKNINPTENKMGVIHMKSVKQTALSSSTGYLNRYIVLLAGFLICIVLNVGCTINSPSIIMTTDKTMTENQIIGEYREVEKNAWAVSSVQTSVQKTKGSIVPSGDEELFRAMKVREFNQGALREYKNEGAVGERNDGYVAYVSNSVYDSSSEKKKMLMVVVDDENTARKTIFKKSLMLDSKTEITDADVETIAKKFAADEQVRAQKNDWIQGTNGQWIRKK